jgi:hypothetical protein
MADRSLTGRYEWTCQDLGRLHDTLLYCITEGLKDGAGQYRIPAIAPSGPTRNPGPWCRRIRIDENVGASVHSTMVRVDLPIGIPSSV